MSPTPSQRLAIIAVASVALATDILWMLNSGSDSTARRKVLVPAAVMEQSLADFGAGPMVGNVGTEGDLARAGYLWATEKRPSAEINCPAHIPAFQRGCSKWLADIHDLDQDWSGDSAPR